MRRLGGLILAVLLLAALGRAAEAASPGDAATLARLTGALMAAVERKDRARLDQLLAPDFVLTVPGEPLSKGVPRALWIDNAVGKNWSDFRYRGVAVEVLGEGAIVTSHLSFRVSPIPFSLDAGVVDVWLRGDQGWRIHRRYLGDSERTKQLSLAGGMLAALLAVGLLLGACRLVRRRA